MAREALQSGRAAETFQRMVTALGGPADFVEEPVKHLPRAKIVRPALPVAGGAVTSVDTRSLGLAVVTLGGGRTRAEDSIDHTVGLTKLVGIGDEVGPDRPLALVHARDKNSADAAANAVRAAYKLGEPPKSRRLIYERIGEKAR
jgi:thymidine phosphorylase